jgi:hypothetical protein
MLDAGSVPPNAFLRQLHDFALDMRWLPWPVLARKQCPKVRFQEKRAITRDFTEGCFCVEGNLAN